MKTKLITAAILPAIALLAGCGAAPDERHQEVIDMCLEEADTAGYSGAKFDWPSLGTERINEGIYGYFTMGQDTSGLYLMCGANWDDETREWDDLRLTPLEL